LGDLDIGGRKILEWTLVKRDGYLRDGFICPRMGTSGMGYENADET
jgi:hypothetical protein